MTRHGAGKEATMLAAARRRETRNTTNGATDVR